MGQEAISVVNEKGNDADDAVAVAEIVGEAGLRDGATDFQDGREAAGGLHQGRQAGGEGQGEPAECPDFENLAEALVEKTILAELPLRKKAGGEIERCDVGGRELAAENGLGSIELTVDPCGHDAGTAGDLLRLYFDASSAG